MGVPSSIPAKGSAGVESLLLAAPRAPDALPEGDFLEAWSGGQRPSQVSWVCLPGTPASSCWAAPGGVQATRARRNWMAPCLAGLWKEKAPLDRAPRWTRQGQRRGTGGASDRGPARRADARRASAFIPHLAPSARPRLLRRVTHSAGLRPQNVAASPSGGRRSEVKGPSPRPLLPPGSSSAAAASPPASPMSSPWARVRVRMSPFCEDVSRGSAGTPLRGDLILTDHTCSDLSSDAATF